MAYHIGVGYPLRIDGERGWVEIQEDLTLINSAIKQILGTRVGERVMNPEFGSQIPSRLMRPLTLANQRLIAWDAINAIERWEPRVKLQSVQFVQSLSEEEQGIIRLDLQYLHITTGQPGATQIFINKDGVI
ncbi:MAG TPA: GPW/gp25 family protein [Candidatus Sumerlaeota bacterium]|nr:GPW/gp25 family protein [Candidatus Sumerlaeota bacterium]